ncbi:hypothetical protein AC579_3627 [Pseudocercospora musae]|uniref:DNA replication regulator Sld3 C-terminal domain-containing protein n=1 Tax=Pseudocercospora musae TaxID=113226 RepID=A0A139ISN2_9PEZI|nr:hypothetical protein AC579_3627 [Pseudocercospora musae]
MSIHRETCISRDTIQDQAHVQDEAPRKRKRDDSSEAHIAIDTRPLDIRPNSSNPFAKPLSLKPQCLLDRSQLPLAYLDTTHDGTRLFAAHIQALEACHEYRNDINVLIVEEEEEQRLYAVERVQKRQYALCRLRSSVRRDEMIARSRLDVRPHGPQQKRQALQFVDAGKPWWMSASVDRSTSVDTWTGQKPKLSLQAATEGRPVSAGVVQVGDNNIDIARSAIGEVQPEDVTDPKPTSPEDALEELAKHYLDTLYLSRTPLSYFVKGPLARARAVFSAQPAELISFLRGAILSASVADKKYRESVSELVREMSLLETPESKPKTRRKRKWKTKRDKYGFFVDEKEYVEQWWRKDDEYASPPSSVESLESRLQRRLRKVRNRETFLQVILTLETMALEASAPPASVLPPDLESQNVESQAEDTQAIAGEKKSRKRKEVDLASVIQTLIDRLSIWYSLDTSSPLKTKNDSGTAAKDDAKDDLKDFATEVVIPFWSSRIFDQANVTSKQLGGPAAPGPLKRKSGSAPRRPGDPATRPAPEKKPRKPLERASTDTLNRRRAPSLHRAATDQDALAPLIKREQSEQPSLKSIPQAKANAQSRKHVSLLDQAMGSRRQVDFSAMSQASEAKLREKAKREQLVREAVSGIRKPNRSLATEETAKKADESFARELAKKKSSKSQTQRSTTAKEAAPITATPRHIKATPAPRRRTQASSNKHSGTNPIVLSSSAKLFAQPGDVVGSTPAVPQTGHRSKHSSGIEDTPSRGFAKYMPAGLGREPGTLLESPSAIRIANIKATPLKPMPSLSAKSRLQAVVEASPDNKHDDSGIGLDDTTDPTSIYKTLGWDDDDDYEPLQ